MTPYDIYQALDHDRFAAWWEKKYPGRLLHAIPGIGKIRHDGDRFVFDAAGKDAAILLINDDLVAWYHDKTTIAYQFNGHIFDANISGLCEAVVYGKSFQAHDSVMSWLIADCTGGCPLSESIWLEYKQLPEITVSTAEMARRVEQAMNRLAKVPTVRMVE